MSSLRRAGLVGLGLVLLLVASEVALRLIAPVWNVYLYEFRGDHLFNRPRFDDLYAPWAVRHDLPQTRVVTNGRGERDERDHDQSPPAGTVRLVHLGSSVGFAWRLPIDQVFLRRLEARFANLETINCSLFDATTVEAEVWLERACGDYTASSWVVEIDVDLMGGTKGALAQDLFGPDYRFIRLLHRKYGDDIFAHVRFGDDGLPRLEPGFLAREPEPRRFYNPKLPLYGASHLVRLIDNYWLTSPEGISGGAHIDARLLRQPLPLEAEALAGLRATPTLQALARLRERVRGRGAELLVLVLPATTEPSNDRAHPDLLALRQGLSAGGFAYVDLVDRLLGDAKARQYGAHAHEVIADGLADYLETSGAPLRRVWK